jgi:hypothetical protein
MSYKVVIPSYHRETVIQEKTLPLLLNRGVKADSIYIFVADKTEYEKYVSAIPKDKYKEIIIGKKGISYQRNFIIDYFKDGEYLIFIDDDITNIRRKKSGKVSDLTDLDDFIKTAYKALKDEKKFLWTTKNMYNPFYKNLMKNYAVVGFAEFSGDFMGIINRKSMKIKYTLEEGEGEQLELLFMYQEKDEGVIRYDNVIVISTKLTKGGKIDERGSKDERIKSLLSNNKKLLKAYPQYIKTIDTKGDKYRKERSKIIINKPESPLKQIDGGKIKNLDSIPIDDFASVVVKIDDIDKTDKIEKLQNELYALLENADIPKIEGKRKDLKKTRGDLIGYKGWTFNMGIGRRRNLGISPFSANEREPELFKKVVQYGNEILPTGFKYSTITVNRNLKAKKHIDGGNTGFGAITFLGDYTGGGLYIYDTKDTPKLYDTHNRLIVFNGANLAHRTEPFKGTRYALIYYNQQTEKKIKGIKMEGNGIEGLTDY